MASSYTFGDTDVAARRLGLLFEAFEPEMRAFLGQVVTGRPGQAIDLGCGIGLTTAMLAEATGATHTMGVDMSASFVARANAGLRRPGLEFLVGDVAASPLPSAPADVLFCHLLLTHLPEPIEAVANWATQLAPNGLVLIDEVESIATSHADLARYLEMVASLVQVTGGDLYVGPRLASMPAPAGTTIEHNELREHRLTAAVAAGMFRLNLATFRERPEMRERYGDELQSMAGLLDGLVQASDPTPITWQMRPIAVRRTDAAG